MASFKSLTKIVKSASSGAKSAAKQASDKAKIIAKQAADKAKIAAKNAVDLAAKNKKTLAAATVLGVAATAGAIVGGMAISQDQQNRNQINAEALASKPDGGSNTTPIAKAVDSRDQQQVIDTPPIEENTGEFDISNLEEDYVDEHVEEPVNYYLIGGLGFILLLLIFLLFKFK